ncbi:MAG: histidine phosphatase family protein [Microbacterium sp.]
MTTLLLVRHGETDWNAARRIQGSTDIPLNDTGREQARETAAALAARFAGQAPVVASSDLSRARETAEIIAEALGVAGPRLYPQLRERSYGVAEGMTIEEYLERFGAFDRVVPRPSRRRTCGRGRCLRLAGSCAMRVAATRRRMFPSSPWRTAR